MSNHASQPPKNDNTSIVIPTQTEEAKLALRKEIGSKWGKFSESELNLLNSNADLVTHVATKYGLEKAKAQADVGTMMNGRHL
jgi:hypothetical protein